jgi:3-phosphoshikimate 1-carboxyvinyltransferase
MIEELDRPGPHAFDLSDCPDLLPPLAASALLASHPTRIGGASHTRIKESDRIAVLVRGFRALGARIVEHTDGMEILPLADRIPRKVALDPAGDHRMAMAFAAVSLAIPGVSVQDPGCVAKSFPAFWDAIDAIRAAADGPG